MSNKIFLSSLMMLLIGGILTSGCKMETPIGKWKDGRVPYYLSGNFSSAETETIHLAMAEWEKVADIKFIEVSPRAGAYRIIKISENSWTSSIGENNSSCEMTFGSGGDAYSHVLHELGHALGLMHEHQRPDRDLYIRILWDNLLPQYFINFETDDNPLISEENYSYDYGSIMHYPVTAFSFDGLSETIVSLDEDHPIARTDKISDIDAQKMVEIYGSPVEE